MLTRCKNLQDCASRDASRQSIFQRTQQLRNFILFGDPFTDTQCSDVGMSILRETGLHVCVCLCTSQGITAGVLFCIKINKGGWFITISAWKGVRGAGEGEGRDMYAKSIVLAKEAPGEEMAD